MSSEEKQHIVQLRTQNKAISRSLLKCSMKLKRVEQQLEDVRRCNKSLNHLWTKDDIYWRLRYKRLKELYDELNDKLLAVQPNDCIKQLISIHNAFIADTDDLIIRLIEATQIDCDKAQYDEYLRYVMRKHII